MKRIQFYLAFAVVIFTFAFAVGVVPVQFKAIVSPSKIRPTACPCFDAHAEYSDLKGMPTN